MFALHSKFLVSSTVGLFFIIVLFLQKKESVALNHYELAPSPRIDRNEENEGCDTIGRLTNKAATITQHVESHVNAAFDRSQGEDKSEEKPRDLREISNSVVTKPGKSSEKGKERRVRFDLGAKEKKGRRVAMGNIPDIIVISEEAGGNLAFDENGKKRAYGEEASEDNDNLPTNLSSIFEDSRKRTATLPSVSDDEGTVVEI